MVNKMLNYIFSFVCRSKAVDSGVSRLGNVSVFKKLLLSEMDQFKKSWYMVFYQMPIIPELSMSSFDLVVFDELFNFQYKGEMTHEYFEA